MKRALFIVILLFLMAPVLAIAAFNLGFFQDKIQQTVQEKSGAKVSLGPVRLLYTWPPMARVGPTVIQHPLAEVHWRELSVQAVKFTAPYSIRVQLRDPIVKMVDGSKAQPAAPAKADAGGGGGAATLPPLTLDLTIENGEIQANSARVTSLNLNFRQTELLQSSARMNVAAKIESPSLPVAVALKAVSEDIAITPEKISTQALTATIGGLTANVQGSSQIKDDRHHWKLDLSAQNLATLPQPAEVRAVKNWRGQAFVKAEVSKDGAGKSWHAEGDFRANEVGADLKINDPRGEAEGPIEIQGEGRFAYTEAGAQIPRINLRVDLTRAKVQVPDLLSKAAGVPLKLALDGTGDQQKLKIAAFDVELWNLKASTRGDLALQAPWPASLQFNVQPVNLNGSESLLIPLRASPVQGEFSARGSITGPLGDAFNKARIVISELKLKQFAAVATFEREGMFKVRGPLKADLQSSVEYFGGLKSAQGKGEADLTAAAMVLGPLRKEAGAKFEARFGLRTQGATISIDQMDLASFVGNVSAKGQLRQGTPLDVAVNVEARPLNLSELRIAMPDMRELLPKGEVRGRMKIQGKLETSKPWAQWPLNISGDIDANLPEYILTAAPPSTKKTPPAGVGPGTPATGEKPGAAFLPDGQLTRNLNLALKVKIEKLRKDELQVSGVSTSGSINKGKFSGDVALREIFGGAVQVKGLQVPLITDNPVIQGSAAWQNLITEDVLAFAKPEYKTMASGRMAGTAEFATVMPAKPDFMAKLRARGTAHLEPMTLSTVKIGDMINGMIQKAPMLKIKPVKSEPLRGWMKMQYDLAQGTLNLASLQAMDQNNSEIQMKGKVVLASMTGDLVGTFFWAQSDIKGCALEGNADAQGRLAVPLSIQGNLMSPGASVVGDIFSKLAGKALECEGKKVIEKAKQDGGKALEKELKKTLKNLLGK